MFDLFKEKNYLREENKKLQRKIDVYAADNQQLNLQLDIMVKMLKDKYKEIESLKEQNFEFQKELVARNKRGKSKIVMDKDKITTEVVERKPRKTTKKTCVGAMDSTGIAVIDVPNKKTKTKAKSKKGE